MPEIRTARREELPATASLLAASLGFRPADAVAPWLMRTTDECGGMTLVALEDDVVIGASYALPAWSDGEPYLFSCGLAVAAPHRGRRLGLELKLAQRRLAVERGYRSIRWTADPVNGRALRLYLTGLGARLVAYRAGLHDGLRADPQDDVDILWPLTSEPLPPRAARRVELPWASPSDADRARVREAFRALLAEGYVGTGVDIEARARKCWMTFR